MWVTLIIVGALLLLLAVAMALVIAGAGVTERHAREGHNDLDYACRYWWGDRQGSLTAHCSICNPEVSHGNRT